MPKQQPPSASAGDGGTAALHVATLRVPQQHVQPWLACRPFGPAAPAAWADRCQRLPSARRAQRS
eukprot:scaffold1875_cov339-Prasinococcus_capsulatus_cf.AAC.6